jgi:hypothetical protein
VWWRSLVVGQWKLVGAATSGGGCSGARLGREARVVKAVEVGGRRVIQLVVASD